MASDPPPKKAYVRPTFDSTIKSRTATTPLDLQRHALQKLLADPAKPAFIPDPPREGVKTLRPPRETMKNVQGSSAGAGSGEFHVYKQSRRREYERLKLMDEEEEYNKAKNDALQRQLEYQTAADERTAKNRLKRQRKKAGRGGKPKTGAGGSDEEDEGPAPETGGEKKRKLGGAGGGMKFKTAEERERDEAEELLEEEERRRAGREDEKESEGLFVPSAAQEAGIVIKDDD